MVERERFEAWAKSIGYNIDRKQDGRYWTGFATVLFEAWQEALSAAPVAPTEPPTLTYADLHPAAEAIRQCPSVEQAAKMLAGIIANQAGAPQAEYEQTDYWLHHRACMPPFVDCAASAGTLSSERLYRKVGAPQVDAPTDRLVSDLRILVKQHNLSQADFERIHAWATAAQVDAPSEPVAWWRISYIDEEGNSDADVQIGKNKPTEMLMQGNGFEWEPLYAAPVAQVDAPRESGKDLITDLIFETERAMRQRDEFLKTGVSTASHGGSHDTVFGFILKKHGVQVDAPPADLRDALRYRLLRSEGPAIAEFWWRAARDRTMTLTTMDREVDALAQAQQGDAA